ncbi:MAG TPA: hypothetical protein VE174_02565 [Actinomycetota bacterium]|nr:hypothetical protein [Actinomycetota bacterium]
MAFNWNDAPGSSPAVRRRATLRKLLGSLIVGLLSVSVAWAGTGLVPVNDVTGAAGSSSGQDGNWLAAAGSDGGGSQAAAAAGTDQPLSTNQVYAGAAKVNIAPNPEKYSGTWEKDQGHCETFAAPHETEPAHATDFRVRFNENTNCIYAGGFDIGPANAITKFDEEYGMWARATAVSDGDDTVVLMILDGAYYFAKYANMCNTVDTHKSDFDGDGPGANKYTQDCGFRDLGISMAEKYGYKQAVPGQVPAQVPGQVSGPVSDQAGLEKGSPAEPGQFGIEPSSFFLASSHAHASPDFIGAWGGVPRWYMQQVEDAIRKAVYDAVDSMRPSYIEAGEILFRGGNNHRRGHYRAAEEAGETWMRFVSETPAPPICTTPSPTPTPTPSPTKTKGPKRPGSTPTPTPPPSPTPICTPQPNTKGVVATIGTYAAHPTNSAGGTGYADLAGVFAKRAEERFGGIGLFFQTGFGNISSAYSRAQLGKDLVSLLPDVGAGAQVTAGDGTIDVRTVQRTFDNPATNAALGPGGAAGVFDRPMEHRPSAVSIGKDSLGPDASRLPHKRCNSASPLTVNTSVSAARIGPVNGGLLITGGPGELFSNYTNTIKESNITGITFPLSLVNDGIGYIMQSFETDHVGRQGVGFVNGPLSEYEDAYSIDACLGDHALEQTFEALGSL